jgi:hypothetical protein
MHRIVILLMRYERPQVALNKLIFFVKEMGGTCRVSMCIRGGEEREEGRVALRRTWARGWDWIATFRGVGGVAGYV